MKARLNRLADGLRLRFPEHQFRAFVDTAPVLEREYAARAGLGWIGRHTLLIHPRLGSYTLLGGIFTTLQIQGPPDQTAVPDHCGTCTRCIDACPTGAIEPYSVEASRCISYLTIERRASIAPEFHEKIGDWLYGCDICQEVCPHNSPRPAESRPPAPHTAYAPRHASLSLLEVLGWTEQDRARVFQGSAMKRATLAMMKRNALLVAANQLARRDDPALRQRIKALATDMNEPELVRNAAAQAIHRLASTSSAAPLAFTGETPATIKTPVGAAQPGPISHREEHHHADAHDL
jgi:epoxyqueuosine reductase